MISASIIIKINNNKVINGNNNLKLNLFKSKILTIFFQV